MKDRALSVDLKDLLTRAGSGDSCENPRPLRVGTSKGASREAR